MGDALIGIAALLAACGVPTTVVWLLIREPYDVRQRRKLAAQQDRDAYVKSKRQEALDEAQREHETYEQYLRTPLPSRTEQDQHEQ